MTIMHGQLQTIPQQLRCITRLLFLGKIAIAVQDANNMYISTIFKTFDAELTITNNGFEVTMKGNRHGAVILIDVGSLAW